MPSLVQPRKVKAETAESMTTVSVPGGGVSIKSEVEVGSGFGADEIDLIPLKERLKIVVEGKVESSGSVLERDEKGLVVPIMPINVAIKREEYDCCPPVVAMGQAALHISRERKGRRLITEQGHLDSVGERNAADAEFAMIANKADYGTIQPCSSIANRQETHANDSGFSSQITLPEVEGDCFRQKKVEAAIFNQPKHPIHSSISVKVELFDDNATNLNRDAIYGSVSKVHEECHVKNEALGELRSDGLDHILLKERDRMLVSRISVETAEQSVFLMDDARQHNSGDVKEESCYVDKQFEMVENDLRGIAKNATSKLFQSPVSDSSISNLAGTSSVPSYYLPDDSNSKESLSPKPCSLGGFPERKNGGSSETSATKFESEVEHALLPTLSIKVKDENMEDGLDCPSENALGRLSYHSKLALKRRMGVSNKSSEDEIDHLPLLQRMQLLIPRRSSNLENAGDFKCLSTNVSSVHECNPAISEVDKFQGISSQRKRKKTATNSVEMAMEEDAPGLLKVLVDKGIMIEEMKLYGDMDSADSLDVPLNEDNFHDLETVIFKLFNQRASVLKFAPERSTKGSKRSYCLACLISLVDQTRHLRFRKWPVEWGWCRDLHSFIFIFKRHNRIVLERPEYGYATYFFELVGSLTVDWQIKRLVTAMKLSSCSRATLIENKSLLVGEDLTEAEARVLEEYGWTPNCGLGSMLNYCDRVFHDRNKERDGSEWRTKIGKLLMDGFNGGTIFLANFPKRVGYESTQNPEIKLEL